MKKLLLIIFLSLLGHASFAFTYLDGCIKHRVISGVNCHVALVTLDASAAGASMDLYFSGWLYATSSSPTLVGVNWVYEFVIGGYTLDSHCISGYEIIPTGDPYNSSAQDLTFCHCDFDIQEACARRGTYGNRLATVVYGPDVQGANQFLWYWDPGIPGFAGPFWPTGITQVGTNWVYEYDLGVIPGLFSPLKLYTADDPSLPPTSESDPHIVPVTCETDMVFACFDKVNIGGNNHRIITVAYGSGVVGADVFLWWYNGGFPATGIAPTSKVLVNGFWQYTYDLGLYDVSDPACYDVYFSMDQSVPPIHNRDPHFLACKCDCDPKFGYCIDPTDPYKVKFDFTTPNPLATIKVTVDGTPVYTGAQINLTYDFGAPGNHEVCVEVLGEPCDPYCLRICVAEQRK